MHLFKLASIIPRAVLSFSGKRSGKHSGRAYFTLLSKEKEKRNPLCFKEIPLYAKIFQKYCAFPKKCPVPYLMFMPMHILLVKLIIF